MLSVLACACQGLSEQRSLELCETLCQVLLALGDLCVALLGCLRNVCRVSGTQQCSD